MSEIKHTPGPWIFIEQKNYSVDFFGQGKVIGCGLRLLNQEANIRLIAAAPELLEALIQIRASYARLKPVGYPDSDSEKLADAVIAKAGVQPCSPTPN